MLYFVPNAKAITAELRREHGLDRLLDGSQHRETSNGPDGNGILIGDSSLPADYMHYTPSKQTWSKRFGLSSWVGTWNDRPVAPKLLMRSQLLDGPEVQLLDGNQWQVPTLRKFLEEDQSIEFTAELPRVLQRNTSTGRFVLGDVVPKYRELWGTSLRIADQMFAQLLRSGCAEFDDSEAERFVCDVLATNYRVDADVISHLQLLTQEHCGAIIRAALDWDTLRDHLKKRLAQLSGDTSS